MSVLCISCEYHGDQISTCTKQCHSNDKDDQRFLARKTKNTETRARDHIYWIFPLKVQIQPNATKENSTTTRSNTTTSATIVLYFFFH